MGCCMPQFARRNRAACVTEMAAAAKTEEGQEDRRHWMGEERAGEACATFRRANEGVAGGQRRVTAFAVAAAVFWAAPGSAADVPGATHQQLSTGAERWCTVMIHL